MEFLPWLTGLFHMFIDLVLHLDRHLVELLEHFGPWTYVILFAIIFAETGLVVTPILPDLGNGVLMTNSGKFAQYAPGNTGYAVLYGSLADCVESAVIGKPCFTDIAA